MDRKKEQLTYYYLISYFQLYVYWLFPPFNTRVRPLYSQVVYVENECLDPAVKELAARGVHILPRKDRGLSCDVQLCLFIMSWLHAY